MNRKKRKINGGERNENELNDRDVFDELELCFVEVSFWCVMLFHSSENPANNYFQKIKVYELELDHDCFGHGYSIQKLMIVQV